MFGSLFLLFTLVPALELYLLFQVGGVIGGFNTIMLIIVTGIVGAALAKSQGLSILNRIQTEMQKGELPGDQIIQGLMVFAGGLLLLTPGFMTDIIGFSLVAPGTRHLLIVLVKKMLEKSIQSGNVHFSTFGRAGGFQYTYSSSSATTASDFGRPNAGEQIDSNTFEAEYSKKDDL